jgi:hypothetical protein
MLVRAHRRAEIQLSKLRDGDMRQGQSAKRSRGRSGGGGGGGRRNGSPRHESFDSNGRSIRIRGNASQVYEKYIQLARDAHSAGDRIAAENMYQHAEHYFRLMNVDDGESRPQNRGNGADNRPQHHNSQPEQEEVSGAVEAGTPVVQAAAVETTEASPRPNGSGDSSRPPRDNGGSVASGEDDGNVQKTSETAPERAPRRPRRSAGRPRTKPAIEAAEAVETVETPVVVVEAEVVVEPLPTEVDVKDAP